MYRTYQQKIQEAKPRSDEDFYAGAKAGWKSIYSLPHVMLTPENKESTFATVVRSFRQAYRAHEDTKQVDDIESGIRASFELFFEVYATDTTDETKAIMLSNLEVELSGIFSGASDPILSQEAS